MENIHQMNWDINSTCELIKSKINKTINTEMEKVFIEYKDTFNETNNNLDTAFNVYATILLNVDEKLTECNTRNLITEDVIKKIENFIFGKITFKKQA